MTINLRENNELVADLEKKFGTRIWEPVTRVQYKTDPNDIIALFRIYNERIFDNKLPPMRCQIRRDECQTLAGFVFGSIKAQPVHLEVFSSHYTSFFTLMNTVAHELIHYYDWILGPLNKMFQYYFYVAVDPSAPSTRHPGHPTQMVYPAQFRGYQQAIAAGERAYDCHGSWFGRISDKFNSKGMDVQDIFDRRVAQYRLRRVDEDRDEDPIELRHMNAESYVKSLYDCIIDDDGKQMEFRDKDNWFIAIA